MIGVDRIVCLMYIYIRLMTMKKRIDIDWPILPGSISTARSQCGNKGCSCRKRRSPRLHGTYYRWTGFIDGKRLVAHHASDKIMSDGIDPWTGMRTPNWRSSFRSPYKGMIVVVKPSEKAEFLPTKQWEIPPVSRCGKDCFRLRR